MKITIAIPYPDAHKSTLLWAGEEKGIDFRKEPGRAARCTLSFAAAELGRYLEKLGHQAAYMETPSQDTFSISLRMEGGGETGGSFCIRPVQNGIEIVGTDRAGVLYGAYEFLRMQGVRWLYPGAAGDVLPHPTDRLILPETGKQYQPSMTLGRGFDFEGPLKDSEELWLWMARNRLNLCTYRPYTGALQNKLGMTFKSGGHIFEKILSPDRVMPSGRTLWEEHPEWYGLPASGQRTKEKAQHTQFCMSNPELLAFLAGELLGYINGEWYHADRIDVWGFDTWGSSCQCETCRSLGNSTDQTLHFLSYLRGYLNHAIADGRLDHPVRLVMCAYEGTATLTPPVNGIPQNLRSSGDYVVYYPIIRCYEHTFSDADCSYNFYYDSNLKGWGKTADPAGDNAIGMVEATTGGQTENTGIPVMVGEYYNVSKFEDMPLLFTRTMSRDLPHYYKTGVRGMTYMHLPMLCWGVRNLTQLLYAQLCWDVNTDCDVFIEQYFRDRYGTQQKDMRRAYARIEQAFVNSSNWRAWGTKSVLSNLLNWDGQKPCKPFPSDDHLGDYTVEKGEESVRLLEEALGIMGEARRQAVQGFLAALEPVAGIPVNPTDTRFHEAKNAVAERIGEDLRGVRYGRDVMRLLTLFVAYYEALRCAEDTQRIWKSIEDTAVGMDSYYMPLSYGHPAVELTCKDALTRSGLRGLYYRCKRNRQLS